MTALTQNAWTKTLNRSIENGTPDERVLARMVLDLLELSRLDTPASEVIPRYFDKRASAILEGGQA